MPNIGKCLHNISCRVFCVWCRAMSNDSEWIGIASRETTDTTVQCFIQTNSVDINAYGRKFFVSQSKCENRSRHITIIWSKQSQKWRRLRLYRRLLQHRLQSSLGSHMPYVCCTFICPTNELQPCVANANTSLAIFMVLQGFACAKLRTNLIVYTYAISRENIVFMCVCLLVHRMKMK